MNLVIVLFRSKILSFKCVLCVILGTLKCLSNLLRKQVFLSIQESGSNMSSKAKQPKCEAKTGQSGRTAERKLSDVRKDKEHQEGSTVGRSHGSIGRPEGSDACHRTLINRIGRPKNSKITC